MCYNISFQELQLVPVQLKHFRLSRLHHTPLSFCTSLHSNVSILPRGIVPANQWQKLRNYKQKFRNLQYRQHHMPFTTFPFWIIIAGETLSKQFLQHILVNLELLLWTCIWQREILIFSCWYGIITRGSHWGVICHWSQDTDMIWSHSRGGWSYSRFSTILGNGISMVHLLQAGHFSINVCRILSYHPFPVGTQHFLPHIKKLVEAGHRALMQW